jgi:UPF0755 protein
MTNKNRRKKGKIILFAVMIILAASGLYAYSIYQDIFKRNVSQDAYLYIHTGSDYEDLINSLNSLNVVTDIRTFEQTAKLKNFSEKVYPGKYFLEKGMTNNELINMLRSGKQKPVKLTFNNIETIEEFSGKISQFIEADSVEIYELLTDNAILEKYQFSRINIISLFIPNTYEFYWNTSAEKFIEKMYQEYSNFWTDERLKKAQSLNLTKQEVATLASIVQAEQREHSSEKPRIAGLYINRLRRGMMLQSDPTLIFASGDFSKKRVLNRDKEIDSPYNTYKYTGLPPGPINMPEISSIDAVLNYEKNEFIFMCAKENFSGYHNFSVNAKQHGIYARRYQDALNRKKIWK